MSQETVLREFRERRNGERAKALAKYGVAGLAEGGDPTRDVFDYAVNELVGLLRYAEMMEYRIRGLGLPEGLEHDALMVCRSLAAAASRHAVDLVDVRQRLLRRGVELGRAESAASAGGAGTSIA